MKDIVLIGVPSGVDTRYATQRLMALLVISESEAEELVTRVPVVIKRAQTAEDCAMFLAALREIGLEAAVRESVGLDAKERFRIEFDFSSGVAITPNRRMGGDENGVEENECKPVDAVSSNDWTDVTARGLAADRIGSAGWLPRGQFKIKQVGVSFAAILCAIVVFMVIKKTIAFYALTVAVDGSREVDSYLALFFLFLKGSVFETPAILWNQDWNVWRSILGTSVFLSAWFAVSPLLIGKNRPQNSDEVRAGIIKSAEFSAIGTVAFSLLLRELRIFPGTEDYPGMLETFLTLFMIQCSMRLSESEWPSLQSKILLVAFSAMSIVAIYSQVQKVDGAAYLEVRMWGGRYNESWFMTSVSFTQCLLVVGLGYLVFVVGPTRYIKWFGGQAK